tara:strand:+ start:15490 stop:16446 length:957 start_codon:yes stop_codon:yes gene_type:complete
VAQSLSIVIPLFNEAEVLPLLIERLEGVLPALPAQTEILIVDDGSSDGTRAALESAAATRAWLKLIFLSRNFGHQMALTAGMQYATGDLVAIIDGDLQDPPELIPDLVREIEKGNDVVYAVRRTRQGSVVKRVAYWAYYRIAAKLTRLNIPLDSGDFCIARRTVIDTINSLPERHRYIRGLRSWVGFRQSELEYDRKERAAGYSKYTLRKLMLLALDGIFTMTELPLRLATVTGIVVSLSSFAYGMSLVVWRLLTDEPLAGFATLGASIFFLGGLQLIFLGVIGEYIARIHDEVKGRPHFVIMKQVNFADANDIIEAS